MSDLYHRQRAAMLEANQGFDVLLPADPPAQVAVRPIDLPLARNLLGTAANVHASLLVVLGWGDGSLLRWIHADPMLRQRNVVVVLLPGEEAAYASSFTVEPPLLPILKDLDVKLEIVRDEASALVMAYHHFRHHHDIPRLAGCDIISDHPLSIAGEAARRDLSPMILKVLSDRPQLYGNDIMDSFTGLMNAAGNAQQILPSPSIDDCWTMFGQTPVISIAGGPSLRRHIPRLRELQDRCILVACDSVLPGLLREGIQPHFATPLERLQATVDLVQPVRGTRTIFAGSCVVPPAALEPFEGRSIAVFAGDQLYPWLSPEPGRRVNTGSSTGVFSFYVGSSLSSGPVWLVGHDLARDRGASHWEGANYSSGLWAEQKQKINASARVNTGYEDRLIPGNDGGPVPSIAWWDRFRSELAQRVAELKAEGRTTYNVNAHDRVGAVIDGSEAAPLPDPSSLPILPPIQLPERKPERYEQWRIRAVRLPDDIASFRKALGTLREEVAMARLGTLENLNLETLAQRLTTSATVSEGNRMAFDYFLRSALHNTTAAMHLARRTPSTARFKWVVLDAMDNLSHALDMALVKLTPRIEEIARDHR